MIERAHTSSVATEPNVLGDPRVSYQAVVDFLDLEIVTARPTNFNSLRKWTGIPYADPHDAGSGGAATAFRLRLHDLDNWDQLNSIIKRILEHVPLAKAPEISKVELALDAYATGGTREDLVRIAAESYKFLNRLADPKNHRFWVGEGLKLEGTSTHQDTLRRFGVGCTLYIGDHSSAPFAQRIYVKQFDRGESLKSIEWRARLELTMQDAGLPFITVEEAKVFEFSSMASWFKFSELRPENPPMRRWTATQIGQIGAKKIHRRSGGGTRINSASTRAATQRNRQAYDALRYLTRRMQARRG